MGARERTLVKVLIGHESQMLDKKTAEGHIFRWNIFVRPIGGGKLVDRTFISKVQFTLHDSYANHVRVVKEPPFEVSETGYASFMPVVAIQFNYPGSKLLKYSYDMNIVLDKYGYNEQEVILELKDVPPPFLDVIKKYGGDTKKKKRESGEKDKEADSSRDSDPPVVPPKKVKLTDDIFGTVPVRESSKAKEKPKDRDRERERERDRDREKSLERKEKRKKEKRDKDKERRSSGEKSIKSSPGDKDHGDRRKEKEKSSKDTTRDRERYRDSPREKESTRETKQRSSMEKEKDRSDKVPSSVTPVASAATATTSLGSAAPSVPVPSIRVTISSPPAVPAPPPPAATAPSQPVPGFSPAPPPSTVIPAVPSVAVVITPQRPVKMAPNKTEDKRKLLDTDSSPSSAASPSTIASPPSTMSPAEVQRRLASLTDQDTIFRVACVLLSLPGSQLNPSKPSLSFDLDLSTAEPSALLKISQALLAA